MEVVIRLIEHLLSTNYSIDRIDSIVNQLNISKDYLLKLLNDQQYKDCFHLLNNRNQILDKIALTLDLFCCTHYANNCKNQSCSFLHLCPFNIRPMHTKCTNKTCQYDHDVLKSTHNRRIIDTRGLAFIPTRILHEIIRASADPNRSFWVCTDYGKKKGCSKKLDCDKLHFCYYYLTDSCTKPNCQHIINDACLAYFRHREINEQEHNDILDAFKKVLRQRKSDYININNAASYQPSSASSSPKISNSDDRQRKSTNNQQHHTPSSSRRSTAKASATTLSCYDDVLSSNSDSSQQLPILPETDQDILLIDNYDENEHLKNESYLSGEIGCPIKLLTSKDITSENKTNRYLNIDQKSLYYYCPIKNPVDIFGLLRWQNEENQSIKPLIVYASIRDAHDAAEQNFSNNQFCIFRVHLFPSGIINGDLLPQNRLQLNTPIAMRFDHMWVYVYNL